MIHDHSCQLPSPRKVHKEYLQLKDERVRAKKRFKVSAQDPLRQRKKVLRLKTVSNGLRKRLCDTGRLISVLLFRESSIPSLKTFALTMHFYSAKAYSYLRKFVKFPHPRTIRKWALAVDGNPGFTEESFRKIASEAALQKGVILDSLMVDEMALKKQLDYDGKKVLVIAA